MKLTDLKEMTMRTGVNMDNNIPDFPSIKHHISASEKYVGKMQHGYSVFSYNHNNTTIYAGYNGDEWVGMVQYSNLVIPHYGSVLNTLNTKTSAQYRGDKLSLQLRLFVSLHLGLNQLVGDVISLATEKLLPHMLKHFSMKLINIKTGDMMPYTQQDFIANTSIHTPTDWRVLLEGASSPMKESDNNFGWAGPEHEDRHKWTYFNFFEDIE